jgi:glycerol uptake facilitator-like aquaporin
MFLQEFFGTFIFVFAILCITSIEGLNKFQIALGIGIALTISILICLGLNKDSKAHLNPAVSTAMFIKGDDFNIKQFLIFIGLQIIAAVLAFYSFKFFQTDKFKV